MAREEGLILECRMLLKQFFDDWREVGFLAMESGEPRYTLAVG
jgi:hypothetical protein